MKNIPKKGTIERVVFDKLVAAGDKGITRFDFADDDRINEDSLAEAIFNIQHGTYESEMDDQIKFDS